MPIYLSLVYLFVADLFLFCPASGNLAGAVDGGRSARIDGERTKGGGRRIMAFRATIIVVAL